jgi:hypothetical protein
VPPHSIADIATLRFPLQGHTVEVLTKDGVKHVGLFRGVDLGAGGKGGKASEGSADGPAASVGYLELSYAQRTVC